MKRELWKKVKVGSWVIYADQYLGVFKAKVTEIDLMIYTPGEPSRRGYPYGKTADKGVVKIRYDETETIENLTDLIVYGPSKYAVLRRDWTQWQNRKAAAEGFRDTFLERCREYKTY